jgi:RNA polymerase sigma-70 factor (ECF subfamily)
MDRHPGEQGSSVTRRELSVALANSEPPAAVAGFDFRGLFDEYLHYVFHTLRRLGVPDRDLEDMTHEVFLRVYQRRDQYDPTRPARAWLFGFALRVAAGYRRLARHRRELLETGPEQPDSRPSAAENLEHDENLDLAFSALSTLPLERRAVFVLHELDGCAIPEVAAALGIPLNTAYSRLRLARADFKAAAKRLALQQGPR